MNKWITFFGILLFYTIFKRNPELALVILLISALYYYFSKKKTSKSFQKQYYSQMLQLMTAQTMAIEKISESLFFLTKREKGNKIEEFKDAALFNMNEEINPIQQASIMPELQEFDHLVDY